MFGGAGFRQQAGKQCLWLPLARRAGWQVVATQAVLCCGVSHLLRKLFVPPCLAGNKLYQQGSRSVTGLEAALSCGGLQHKAGKCRCCRESRARH